MALTQKKKDFARAKLQGKSNIDAAIEAGYAERSAGAKGSQLAVDPDVVAYLASLNFQGGGGWMLRLWVRQQFKLNSKTWRMLIIL